ncbi:MAG: hypothetical protein K6T74_15310 [Geminicoccaceae bacterium]|nr:hypothetical protein [Geminicoccaceae bacterium]
MTFVAPTEGPIRAGVLDRNGVGRGIGNRWTRERENAPRSGRRIPVHRPAEDGRETRLDLTDADATIGVASNILRLTARSANATSAAHPDGHPGGLRPYLHHRGGHEPNVQAALFLTGR